MQDNWITCLTVSTRIAREAFTMVSIHYILAIPFCARIRLTFIDIWNATTKFFICKKHAMAVGTGGGRGEIAPPPIFWQPKKFKIIKTTTYRSVYRYMAKIC